MKRCNKINTTVAVALVIVAVVGCAVSAQAATLGYWRFEDNDGSAVADGTIVPLTSSIRDEVGGSHLNALVNPGDTHTSPLWEGDDAGELFGAAVPNPDPLDTDSNGTINANGVNTRSLRFDAQPNYVRRDDDDVLDITGPFTIEGYFRVDSPAASQSEIFVYKRNNAQAGLGYQAWMDIFGRVHVMADNGPIAGRVAWDDTRLDDGQWHHFAGIRDDDNDLHIFIDGVEDTTPATNGITNVAGDLTNNETFRVGSNGLNGMTGYLDEIRLSNVALTPDQFLNADVSVGGDYNGDRLVNALDYPVWRNHLGDTGAPGTVLGDGTGDDLLGTPDGDVDQFDYEFWKLQFGNSQSGASNSLAIPEPATLAMAGWSLLALAARRGSR